VPDPRACVERLSIRSEAGRIRDARDWFARIARQHDCHESDVRDLAVALSEACSNAIRYGYEGREEERVELEVRIGPEAIELAVRDFGKGFDPRDYREPELGQPRVGGYGIYLMRQLADRVEHRTVSSGTLVVMTKQRSKEAEVEHVR